MTEETEVLSGAAIKYIIALILDNANDAMKDAAENPNEEFYQGRKFAYEKIIEIIQNELEANDMELKEFYLENI